MVVKVGDTVADIEEARNAGCVSVGVLRGSSQVGLSEDETAATSIGRLSALFDQATQTYEQAGADFVIEEISDLPDLVDILSQTTINDKELAYV